VADQKPEEPNVIPALKQFFKAYVTDIQVRDIIETQRFTALYTNSSFTVEDLEAVPPNYRKIIPDYIKDYVSLNQFVA
jgi:type I restriction enzyme, R subunit